MILAGIIVGLGAALLQAFSYLISRHLLVQEKLGPKDLLLRAHIFMGLISLAGLPFTWMTPENTPLFIRGLFVGSLGYFAAQGLFFWSIRHAPASRIAPMLGLKLITSAILMIFIRGEMLLPLQILAVALTVLAAVAVQYSGEKIPLKPLVGTLSAGVCFGCSDLGISWMCDGLYADASSRSPWVAIHTVLFTYTFIMLPCLAISLIKEKTPKKLIKKLDGGSLLYATVWLMAMFCLFYTFSTVGIVFGGIVQATRGPLAVFLAVALVSLGWHHLEMQRSRTDFIKQALSALMMASAMALYCIA